MEFISKDSKHYAEAIRLFGLEWIESQLPSTTDADVETAVKAAKSFGFYDLEPDHPLKRQMLGWWRIHIEARSMDRAEAMLQARFDHLPPEKRLQAISNYFEVRPA